MGDGDTVVNVGFRDVIVSGSCESFIQVGERKFVVTDGDGSVMFGVRNDK